MSKTYSSGHCWHVGVTLDHLLCGPWQYGCGGGCIARSIVPLLGNACFQGHEAGSDRLGVCWSIGGGITLPAGNVQAWWKWNILRPVCAWWIRLGLARRNSAVWSDCFRENCPSVGPFLECACHGGEAGGSHGVGGLCGIDGPGWYGDCLAVADFLCCENRAGVCCISCRCRCDVVRHCWSRRHSLLRPCSEFKVSLKRNRAAVCVVA